MRTPGCNALAGLLDSGGIPTQGGATRLRRSALPWADMWLALRADDPASVTTKNKRWMKLDASYALPLRPLVVMGSYLKSMPFGTLPVAHK